eukprot:403343227
MTEWLGDLWKGLKTSDVYEPWTLGWVSGLTTQRGLYNNFNLKQTLAKDLKPFGKVAKKLVVSAVDVNSGKYITFDETMPFSDLPTAVLASSSIPFLFPPTKFQGHLLMDGGTVWNTNMVSAVDKCKELGFSEKDVLIDILLLNQPSLSKEDRTKDLTAIENYFRRREIAGYYDTLSDVESFKRAQPNVEIRHLFIPSVPLSSGLGKMSFDWKDTEFMFEAGKVDAKAYLDSVSGQQANLMSEWINDSELQKSNPDYISYINKHTYKNIE